MKDRKINRNFIPNPEGLEIRNLMAALAADIVNPEIYKHYIDDPIAPLIPQILDPPPPGPIVPVIIRLDPPIPIDDNVIVPLPPFAPIRVSPPNPTVYPTLPPNNGLYLPNLQAIYLSQG